MPRSHRILAPNELAILARLHDFYNDVPNAVCGKLTNLSRNGLCISTRAELPSAVIGQVVTLVVSDTSGMNSEAKARIIWHKHGKDILNRAQNYLGVELVGSTPGWERKIDSVIRFHKCKGIALGSMYLLG